MILKPIFYDANRMNDVVLISKDDTPYKGQYLDMRIDRVPTPDVKYAYECRHEDSDWVTPVTIENHVFVNFAGTFITVTPIVFPNAEDPFIELKGWEQL